MTESGKDYLLRRLFLDRYPRALILDPLGEWPRDRGDWRTYRVQAAGELRPTLARAVRDGSRWRVYAALGGDAGPELARILVPEVLGVGSAFPLHVGGMALYSPELDQLAPTSAPPEVVGLWRRGRHVGLSIFGASQRPHGIGRIVTAMSGWLVITKTIEPRDLAYLRGFIPAPAHAEVVALPWRWAVLVDTRGGRWWVLDDAQKTVRSGRLNGAPTLPG
jgi:hypothetical protein